MNRWIATIFLVLGTLPLASAAEITAIVGKITGKVEVKAGAAWVPVKVGQTLAVGATVQTGFRSEVQLKIGPSTVTIKALSRLTVKDLVQNGSDLKTDLYLRVGKLDAEVNKSEVVKSQTFVVGSPVSTASVRGTAFTFDTVNLEVSRGEVDFSDRNGNLVRVPLGEAAQASETGGDLAANDELIAEELTTQADAGGDFGTDGWTEADWEAALGALDEADLLAMLEALDWLKYLPNAMFVVGGITP